MKASMDIIEETWTMAERKAIVGEEKLRLVALLITGKAARARISLTYRKSWPRYKPIKVTAIYDIVFSDTFFLARTQIRRAVAGKIKNKHANAPQIPLIYGTRSSVILALKAGEKSSLSRAIRPPSLAPLTKDTATGVIGTASRYRIPGRSLLSR